MHARECRPQSCCWIPFRATVLQSMRLTKHHLVGGGLHGLHLRARHLALLLPRQPPQAQRRLRRLQQRGARRMRAPPRGLHAPCRPHKKQRWLTWDVRSLYGTLPALQASTWPNCAVRAPSRAPPALSACRAKSGEMQAWRVRHAAPQCSAGVSHRKSGRLVTLMKSACFLRWQNMQGWRPVKPQAWALALLG